MRKIFLKACLDPILKASFAEQNDKVCSRIIVSAEWSDNFCVLNLYVYNIFKMHVTKVNTKTFWHNI